jgi:hypothetical protein
VRFWRETGGAPLQMLDFAAFWRATKDAFGLAYLKGGGAACNYPDERFLIDPDVVSSLGFLWIPAGFRFHHNRGILRSLSRLASSVPIF